nr:hypothetical protein CFP56_75450 [Quercus suber]
MLQTREMECEFASRERSGEEDAELQRSTKKVKEDQARGPQQVGREEGAGFRATLSYKASLVGDIPGAYAQAFKVQVDDDEEPFSDEEVDDPSEGSDVTLGGVQVDLDAPLPRSILIGRFKQDILYEGIGSLCFSCGRLGNWKNCYPYTVHEPTVEQEKANESEAGRKDADVAKNTYPDEVEAGIEKDDYGPWMLVGCRKFDSRSRVSRSKSFMSNPDHISSLNAKDLGRLRRLSPEVTPPTCTPSISADGKRKLGGFDYTNLTSDNRSSNHVTRASATPNSELPKTTYCPSVLKGHDPTNAHFTPNSNYPKSDSPTPSPKVKNKTNPKLSLAKKNHGEKSQKAVGNKNSRKNNAAIPFAHPTDSSTSHHDLGVVRTGASSSMEQHISINSRESDTGFHVTDRPDMARLGQPLMEISIGHSVISRKEDSELEGTLTNFAGSSFARIKPSGGGSNKENLGRKTNGNKFCGVFGSHQDDSGMWEIPTNKSFDRLKGAAVGDVGACDMHIEEQGGSQVQDEGAKLELAKSSKKSVSD